MRVYARGWVSVSSPKHPVLGLGEREGFYAPHTQQ